MKIIKYADQTRYGWATKWLKFIAEPLKLRIKMDPEIYSLELDNDLIAQLLERINDTKKTVILPSLLTKSDHHRWLVTGPDLPRVEQTLNRIRHFLVPTYAIFDDGQIPILHKLKDAPSPILKSGVSIYPEGYYCTLKSRPQDLKIILSRLQSWLQLEKERPIQNKEDISASYGMLYERFQLALGTARWDKANEVKGYIKKLNLTTAENLLFLEIEQLASQQCWKEIWTHRDFNQLTLAHIPREVRAALLTAFHRSILLEYEQAGQWEEALEAFHKNQARLGLLLTGRLGLTQGPVVRVFAYQAALEKNHQLLVELIDINKEEETLNCIKQLFLILGPAAAKNSERSSRELAIDALHNADYDTARAQTLQIEDKLDQIFILMQIAYYTADMLQAETTLALYQDLSAEEREQLHKRFPAIEHFRGFLQSLLITPASVDTEHADENQKSYIADWMKWFDHFQQQPYDSLLSASLEGLVHVNDERYWSREKIGQLNNHLMSLVGTDYARQPCIRDALRKLIGYFLKDEYFPREDTLYQDLYEYLFNLFLAQDSEEELQNADILLRLAYGILFYAPGKRDEIQQELKRWCVKPIPKLENWVLECLEMLIDYGLNAGLLANWYREWVDTLFMLKRWTQTSLNVWIELGEIILPGADLLDRLQQALAVEQQEDQEESQEDLFTMLPEGYRVVIYTLQEGAAQRARRILLKRNSTMDIRICTDIVLSDSAKSLAKNSNLIVFVTSAMTHTLWYGLGPHWEESKVAYPQSRGSTSIVRAVEDYLKRSA